MAGGETLEVTSQGRIAECGKSGDGAAASAGRFQRGFVGAVGVFLLLTGGLKLLSVLQESRVLGAADPLLSWLTVRQVLFLAAVLELGVGATLLRHRAARWAPGLILWLVLLFGAYRLGRWAVGWEGPCGCLGHLFEHWPGFERWADRVMMAALGGMGGGCLWLLVRSKSTGGWELFGRRPVSIANSLIVLASLNLMGNAYEVTMEGELVVYRADSPIEQLVPTRIDLFNFAFSNSTWRAIIITRAISDSAESKRYGYSMYGSDGEDTYSLVFSIDHLDLSLTNETAFSTAAAVADGQGFVFPSVTPRADRVKFLYTVLGYPVLPESPQLLKGLAIELSEDMQGGPTTTVPESTGFTKTVPSKVRFLFSGYSLVDGKRVQAPKPFDQGFLEGDFIVLEREQVGQWEIPKRFEYRRYIPMLANAKSSADTWCALRLVGSVTNVAPVAATSGPVSPYAGTPVRDYRFRNPTYQLTQLNYTLKEGRWLKREDPWLRKIWETKLKAARLQFGTPPAASDRIIRGTFTVLLAIIVLSPVTFFAFRAWRKRNSTYEPQPNSDYR